jgi:hypothetical protein
MSIVSRRIDSFMGGGRTFANRDIAPQRRVRDFGEAETPEFMMADTTARQSQSLKIRRYGNDCLNNSLSYVPLKMNQENSHAIGASLFNAPIHDDVAQLKVPAPMVRSMDAKDMYAETDVRIPPPLSLQRGIRPEQRMMKFDLVSEAAPAMNRPNYQGMGASRYQMPKVTYDVGAEELRRLYGRA